MSRPTLRVIDGWLAAGPTEREEWMTDPAELSGTHFIARLGLAFWVFVAVVLLAAACAK